MKENFIIQPEPVPPQNPSEEDGWRITARYTGEPSGAKASVPEVKAPEGIKPLPESLKGMPSETARVVTLNLPRVGEPSEPVVPQIVAPEDSKIPNTISGQPISEMPIKVPTAKGLGGSSPEPLPITQRSPEFRPVETALNNETPTSAPDKIGEAEAERQATLDQLKVFAQRLEEVSIPFLGESTEPKVIKQKQDKRRLEDQIRVFMTILAKGMIGQLGMAEGKKAYVQLCQEGGFPDGDLVQGTFLDAVTDREMDDLGNQSG